MSLQAGGSFSATRQVKISDLVWTVFISDLQWMARFDIRAVFEFNLKGEEIVGPHSTCLGTL